MNVLTNPILYELSAGWRGNRKRAPNQTQRGKGGYSDVGAGAGPEKGRKEWDPIPGSSMCKGLVGWELSTCRRLRVDSWEV